MSAAGSTIQRSVSLVAIVAIVALFLPVTAATAFEQRSFDASNACPADTVPQGRFTDAGATHGDAVRCLAWYGVVRGTTPTTFEPGASVTRGQTATIAVNLLEQLTEIDLPTPIADAFRDIDGTAHQAAIETLAAFDPAIVAGLDGDTFDPGDAVTRGQFSSILVRVLDEVAMQREGLEALPAGQPRFDDVIGSVHEPAISRLNEVGVIGGFPDGTFRPNASITRGQVATLLAAAMGGMADAGLLPQPEPVEPPDLDVALRLTEVASVSSVTAAAAGPDGTLYIGERGGTVRPLTAAGAGSPVVDISDQVTATGEGGLLGLAFAADGEELYLSYTDVDGDTAIDAVAVVDGQIVADDRRAVYASAQPASNHNGGDIQVGPDGLLYIGLGDGGGGGDPFGNGQDLSTPLGAMLRIDPQGGSPYAVPPDNPFVDQSDAVDEIFAYGCATPGGSHSTAIPATSTSPTSVRAPGRRSTICRPGPARGPTSGGAAWRGPCRSRGGPNPQTTCRRSTSTPPAATRAARSPGGSSTAVRRSPSCAAPTSTATSATRRSVPSSSRAARSSTRATSGSQAARSCRSRRALTVSCTCSTSGARCSGSSRPDGPFTVADATSTLSV